MAPSLLLVSDQGAILYSIIKQDIMVTCELTAGQGLSNSLQV